MREKEILSIMLKVKNGELTPEDGLDKMRHLAYDDLGYAKIDNHREIRTGFPEIIFCQGKNAEQIEGIVLKMCERGSNILATRAEKEVYERIKVKFGNIEYNKDAKIFFIKNHEIEIKSGVILVATGGTSDIPVAEEAAMTAEKLGNRVERLYDVGVAGIHRLLDNQEKLRNASVIIAVAGMEGALASVIGGMTDKPVIAVPTSIGYGANFGGLAALLAMLNSCASGVGVVNIDNGFGAGYLAATINRQIAIASENTKGKVN